MLKSGKFLRIRRPCHDFQQRRTFPAVENRADDMPFWNIFPHELACYARTLGK